MKYVYTYKIHLKNCGDIVHPQGQGRPLRDEFVPRVTGTSPQVAWWHGLPVVYLFLPFFSRIFFIFGRWCCSCNQFHFKDLFSAPTTKHNKLRAIHIDIIWVLHTGSSLPKQEHSKSYRPYSSSLYSKSCWPLDLLVCQRQQATFVFCTTKFGATHARNKQLTRKRR